MSDSDDEDDDCCCDNELQQSDFVGIFFVIIFSWILIDLWGRVLRNLCHNTLDMDPRSTYNAFVIALTITIVFLICIYYLGKEKGTIVKNKVLGTSDPVNLGKSKPAGGGIFPFNQFNNIIQ